MTVADIAKNTEHRLKQNEILQIAKELNILPLPHKEKTSFWQAVKFSSSQAGFNPDFMFKNNANQFLVIEISCSPNSPKLMKEMIS